MSTEPRFGDIRYTGDVKVFFMAICPHCDFAMPFESLHARAVWMQAHPCDDVTTAVDVRPAIIATEKTTEALTAFRDKLTRTAKNDLLSPCNACSGAIHAGDRYVYLDDFYHRDHAPIHVLNRMLPLSDHPSLHELLKDANLTVSYSRDEWPKVAEIPGGVLITPDPHCEPGEWSPLDDDALKAAGFHEVGFISEDHITHHTTQDEG